MAAVAMLGTAVGTTPAGAIDNKINVCLRPNPAGPVASVVDPLSPESVRATLDPLRTTTAQDIPVPEYPFPGPLSTVVLPPVTYKLPGACDVLLQLSPSPAPQPPVTETTPTPLP